MIADQAVQSNGAADAVRGISSTVEELAYIIENSESSGLIVQDSATLEKLLPVLKQAVSCVIWLHSFFPLKRRLNTVYTTSYYITASQ